MRPKAVVDPLIDAVETRVQAIYTKAMIRSMKRTKRMDRIIYELQTGKVRIPDYYVQRGIEDQYIAGWVKQKMRQEGITQACAHELALAGKEASDVIQTSLVDGYALARTTAITDITKGCTAIGFTPSFYRFNRREMAVLVQGYQTPFSKIAYHNLGNETVISRRLERSFGDAIINGTGRGKLVESVKTDLFDSKVINLKDAIDEETRKQAEYQAIRAKTICQTEMTRIESEANYDVVQDAVDQGIELEQVWHCRFQNSRESHMDMEGQTVKGDAPFISGDGNELRFPGDPSAPPEETINCHCVVPPPMVKAQSSALAKYREEKRKKREEWVAKNINSEEYNKWRNRRDKLTGEIINKKEAEAWR